jgi:PHD/YefM family antitoxin component YafN of YafNO toxin-antitoxin module
MTTVEHAQSLAEFLENPTGTFDRLRQSAEPEVITVDGEARAVLVSPDKYRELKREYELSQLVADIKESRAQIKAGNAMEMNEYFDQLHAKLLAMKAALEQGSSK